MKRGYALSFFLGCVFSFAVISLPIVAKVPTLPQVEKYIDAFVHAFHCRIAKVEDVDVWERKILVNVKGMRFVMTAYSGETYEICPVGTKVKTLGQPAPKKRGKSETDKRREKQNFNSLPDRRP